MRWIPLASLLLLVPAGCGRGDAAPATPAGVELVDDVGHTVRLAAPARRVVSLKPSLTETLLAMGAGEVLVARSDYDEAPALASLPSVGQALEPNLEVLAGVRPDLVLVFETTPPSQREQIHALGIPTFAVQSRDTADVFRSFRSLGVLVGRQRAADSLGAALRAELGAVAASVSGRRRPSTFVVVWNDPPMTAGPDTYLGELVSIAGGEPAFPELGGRFANVAMEEIVRRQPAVVILPQGEDDQLRLERVRSAPGWRELRALRGTPPRVPSDLISRAGPNLGEAARRLRDAIHPELARP